MANMKNIFFAIKEHLNKNKHLQYIINDASCEGWLCCECLAAIYPLLNDNEYACLEDKKRDISIFKIMDDNVVENDKEKLTHIIEVKLVYSNNWKDVRSDLDILRNQITKRKPNEEDASMIGIVFYIWKSTPNSKSYPDFKNRVIQTMGEAFTSNKDNKFTTQFGFRPTKIEYFKDVKTLWLKGKDKTRDIALLFDYVTCVK